MSHGAVKVSDKPVYLRGVFAGAHVLVFLADLHGHLSLADVTAQVAAAAVDPCADIFLNKAVVFRGSSHAAGAEEGNVLILQGAEQIAHLYAAGASVNAEADKISGSLGDGLAAVYVDQISGALRQGGEDGGSYALCVSGMAVV